MSDRPFSLLTDELPSSIYLPASDSEIPIRTDTMTALQCLSVIDRDDVPEAARVSCVIETMIGKERKITPSECFDAFSAILDFLKGYPVEGGTRSNEPVFSYAQDHAYIVAAFRQAYGMALEEVQRLHWWEFQALLSGMPEDTRLSQIIGVRGIDIDPKASPAEKMRLQKAKAAVRLKRRRRKGETGFDVISRGLIEGDKLYG